MPGTFILHAGGTLILDAPSISTHAVTDDSDALLDKFLRGNYLITSIRHVISPSTWSSYLEISKDTLDSELSERVAQGYTLYAE